MKNFGNHKKLNSSIQSSAVSVIVTLLNESSTIDELMQSLLTQSLLPKSIIITDGGSTDGTWEQLRRWQNTNLPVELTIVQVRGNRSLGRNRAVELANTKSIACTDAGCVPEKNWLKELIEEQKKSGALVVAGYYRGLPLNAFQIAQVPYVLTMPDKVDSNSFLPATRSMLFNKQWFCDVGGFDENLSDNEDYALARKIRDYQSKTGKKILSFTQKAVVGWRPRRSLGEFVWMIFRFARGDARAHLWRPKIGLIFFRYFLLLSLAVTQIYFQSVSLFITIILVASTYLLWSVAKNYRYALSAWYWLPVLQITSDIAVMFGTIAGVVQKR